MAVRFRIRTPAGQELSFATLEVFKDFVRSGDLSPEDLVYDAEDGSWSPARAHPIVLDIEYAKEADAEAAAAESGAEGSEKAGLGLSLAPDQPRSADEENESVTTGHIGEASATSDRIAPAASENAFGLELAPESEGTHEEAARAFVEKMEAEREASMDFGLDSGVGGFSMDGSSTLGDMLTPAPPAPAPSAPVPSGPPPPRAVPRPPDARPPVSKPRDRPPEPTPVSPDTGGLGKGFVRLLLVITGVGLVGGAGYFGYQSFGAIEVVEPDPAVPMEPLPAGPEPEPQPTPEPVIAQTEMAIRERSQERFLTSTQNALRELLPIPDSWATGSYFSVPSDHPDILAVWEDYLRTIRTVRAADERRYSAAFELALDDAAITADARAQRRERALANFALSDEARSAHYDRVEALASAAIQSHNALVESEGLILFDPGSGAASGTGMGSGAFGRDAEADLLLSQVIDLLSGSLDGDGLGPGDGVSVRTWVWNGFLDAVAR